ncbi:MAG TPA: heparinase II/III family protein [Pseudolabrys sp.]|nr:heparinase II/III family protein [Pseudolabrys sp.]
MLRLSLAERARLLALIASRAYRTVATRLATHSLLRWRFARGKTDRLVIAPQDLRTADATRATEIYAGRFAFAGKVVVSDSRSPFEIAPPSDEWAAMLLSFYWLRHLRAADSPITRANARSLVDDWITLQGSWNATAWRPEILSRRILYWLCQTPLVLEEADARFYRRFVRSLMRQVRCLRATMNDARDGLPLLQAAIVLTYVGLCMEAQSRWLRPGARKLVEQLNRQVLADGGHISRNPGALIELLLDLLPLRQAFAHRNIPPPAALNNAIDRMMPMLRFFRHGDGNFALFNGMGPTTVDALATVLAYDDARGTPVSNAPHTGYQRLECGKTVLLMDTGRPPPAGLSREANAGPLSFELSWRAHRLVVNCGLPAVGRETWRQVARATAAHSTVTFNEVSSCRFAESPWIKRLLGGVPIIGGPRYLPVTRDEIDGAKIVRASHDGYARDFGVVHTRALRLSADGLTLEGEDSFAPVRGDVLPANARDAFAIRFHLHPAVKANRLQDGHGVILLLPDRDVWTFTAFEDRVEIEESVFLAGPDGPRRTAQIVIYGRARHQPAVQWSFHHAPPVQPGTEKKTRREEPELPL